ncbi:MAG: hypothetical protein KDJ29_00760 [Hyphomicrobiales bacterium]|nr:hypothetical protein [Hyphomicrobiales bacterium]
MKAMAAAVNSRPRPDTNRRDQTIFCIFMEENGGSADGRDRKPADKSLDATGGVHWLSVDLRNLAEPVQRHDHVFRNKTGARYRVKATTPDGEGRLKVYLTLLSGETGNSLTR